MRVHYKNIMTFKLLSSLNIVPVHITTHTHTLVFIHMHNTNKKKKKKNSWHHVNIFFSQTNIFSWQINKCEHECVPLWLLDSSFVSTDVHSFYPRNVMEDWSSWTSSQSHSLTHTHFLSHTFTIMHLGLESAVTIIPGLVPFGCPLLYKNI